jgi:diguanylate cyclase (GGDEF)-like protein/PAS domain S-box-containing protein
VADGQRRAAAIVDFVSERRQAVLELAGGHEIEAYLVNRALGMSQQYGLNANLDFIEQRFRRLIEQKTIRGQPVYSRIVFVGDDGVILAEAGKDGSGGSTLNTPRDGLRVLFDEKSQRIVASSTVDYKGVFSGTVVTMTDLRTVARLLAADSETNATRNHQEFLLTDQGVAIFAPERSVPVEAALGSALAALPEGKLIANSDLAGETWPKNLLALRVSIDGLPLSTLTLMSETEAYGQLASPAYAYYLAAFSIVLLLAVFGFDRMRRRAMLLQIEYSESDRHRSELKQRNELLAGEISRRETVEAALQKNTDVLNKLNADLRIAAAAFDSQEGMVVTDAENKILRVNRAFCEMTGYTSDEMLGQTPQMLNSDHHAAEFYRDIWETVARTDRWQGEIWERAKDGGVFTKWLTISAVKDGDGAVTNYIGTYYDLSERKRAEERIKELAFFDQLTGLPNRALLLDRINHALNTSARTGIHGALLFIDLDNFKTLNDTLGHDKGDLLLKEAGRRLACCVRATDTVARLGGDEFVVLLASLDPQEREAAIQAEAIGMTLLAVLNETYQLTACEHRSTASIGITLFGNNDRSIEELLKRADLAMYEAKAVGRNALRFFDPDMQTAVATRAALEADLREAISQLKFVLHYQAQVDSDGRLTGVEALLRWTHPQRGLVSPAEFIPLAESTGLIVPLGGWVLEAACRQLAIWATRPETEHLTLSVNVSALQLQQKDFVDHLLALLEITKAKPQLLKLELTESVLLNNIEDIIVKMGVLKQKGICFSLDDFGTGYSSLSYLKRLPLDQLKIDRGFVTDILTDPNDAAIAKMIIVLGASLGLAVIAEGVETDLQRGFLARHGCHAYQGYLFSRPLPLHEFEEYARRDAQLPRTRKSASCGELPRVSEEAVGIVPTDGNEDLALPITSGSVVDLDENLIAGLQRRVACSPGGAGLARSFAGSTNVFSGD